MYSIVHHDVRASSAVSTAQRSNLLHTGSILTTYWQKLAEFLVNETMACVYVRASGTGYKIFSLLPQRSTLVVNYGRMDRPWMNEK